MDFAAISVGDVLLIPLVIGWVQVLKEFGVGERWLRVAALLLGAVAFGAERLAVMYPAIAMWVDFVVYVLGGSLAATGLYDVAKQFLVKRQ